MDDGEFTVNLVADNCTDNTAKIPRDNGAIVYERYDTINKSKGHALAGRTCICQVSGRNNISFAEWMRLDMRYISNQSIFFDSQLIMKTFKVILVGDGY